MNSNKVLVLNSNWSPISVVTTREAFQLLFRDSARVLDDESYFIYTIDEWINLTKNKKTEYKTVTPNFFFKKPSIVLLNSYSYIPNNFSSFSKKNLYIRDNFSCQYCGKKPNRSLLTVDHIIPRSLGGSNSWYNCVVACQRCNFKKSDMVLSESGLSLCRQPFVPERNFFIKHLVEKVNGDWLKYFK